MQAGPGLVVRGRGEVPSGETVDGRRPLRADGRVARPRRARGLRARRLQLLPGPGAHQDVPRRPDPDRRSPRKRAERDRARAARRSRPGARHRPPRRRDHRQLGRDGTARHEHGEPTAPRSQRRSHDGSRTTKSSTSSRPSKAKPKIDYMKRAVQDPEGFGITRRQLLGLGGMAAFLAFAAACGTTTTNSGGASTATPAASNTLAGKALESKLQIYNWSQYDAPSTYKKFENLPRGEGGRPQHPRDLLLEQRRAAGQAQRRAPAATTSSRRARTPWRSSSSRASLMALDIALLPNLKNLDPKFLKPSYDPSGRYHVIKDYGITMFFYNNKIITEQPKTMKDFYDLLTKYASKGRTNILDGAEEVVPLALMALGLDPNTSQPGRLRPGRAVPALHPQGRHHHQLVRLHQRRHRRQDHPRSGLERRRAPHRRRGARSRATSRRSSPRRRRRSGRTTGASPPTRRTRWPRTPGSTGCSSRARRSRR